MAKESYSKHQTKIISNYYQNLDKIMLTKLGEFVTDLYLADSAKKSASLWLRAEKAMLKLKIKPAIIDHIMSTRSVEILAKNLQDWQKL